MKFIDKILILFIYICGDCNCWWSRIHILFEKKEQEEKDDRGRNI